MPATRRRQVTEGYVSSTNYRGQNYRGGRQGFSTGTGQGSQRGGASRGGRMISRRQQYYDIRVGMGLSGG